MTWMELYLLLKRMADVQHTSLCDTPSQRVTAIVDGVEYELDIHESLTTGRAVFIPFMETDDVS